MAIAVLFSVTNLRGRWILERKCQVRSTLPEGYGLDRAALVWGIQLGFGLSTYLVTPAMYAVVGMALGSETPLMILAMCVVYGFVRGSTIATFATINRARDNRGPVDVHEAGVGLGRGLRAPLTAIAFVAFLQLL